MMTAQEMQHQMDNLRAEYERECLAEVKLSNGVELTLFRDGSLVVDAIAMPAHEVLQFLLKTLEP